MGWLNTSRLVIVAGKGGVGKTTVSAALAGAAAQRGHTVTAVTIGRSPLPHLLGCEVTPIHRILEEPTDAQIRCATLDPQDALASYLDENGLASLGRRMTRTGMLDLVATSTPGIKELLLLGRLRQVEQSEHTGVVIVDGPAAGHALALLRAPAAMRDMARSGRLLKQAELALAMLGDGQRSQVVLVTLPEHTPVAETIEAAFELEETVGVKLAPVVVNRCAPASPPAVPPTSQLWPQLPNEIAGLIDHTLDADHERHELQRTNIGALTERLGVPHIELPEAATRSGGVDLDALAATLEAGR